MYKIATLTFKEGLTEEEIEEGLKKVGKVLREEESFFDKIDEIGAPIVKGALTDAKGKIVAEFSRVMPSLRGVSDVDALSGDEVKRIKDQFTGRVMELLKQEGLLEEEALEEGLLEKLGRLLKKEVF
ncbi:hypothetical protein KJ632_00170 [Patescibacteria group bacterium]|nr:hypothetical protein [Patescibacteria group bacterium]